MAACATWWCSSPSRCATSARSFASSRSSSTSRRRASHRRVGAAMDFEVTYSDEQQRFRGEVRAWLEANLPPASPDGTLARYRDLRAFGRKLGAKGWLYSRAPKHYGGGGLDVDHS